MSWADLLRIFVVQRALIENIRSVCRKLDNSATGAPGAAAATTAGKAAAGGAARHQQASGIGVDIIRAVTRKGIGLGRFAQVDAYSTVF